MSDSQDITALASDLEARLDSKLGLRRGALPVRMRKAGRRLPRWVHRDAQVIGAALDLSAHPKLRRRVDQARVRAAHRRIADHIDQIDPKEQRTRFVLGVLAGLALNMLAMTGLLLAFLYWMKLI
ncbi:hypothetical protein [Marimonas arenosa]|uniref:Uncharacterized protein n=1 Tax=Marimonas arenosa TaxID=1795305 RepID=A0AAE3WBP3_9RHOB|nr:hypothetical protein [Marimonas arenosa]MDQ2089996.1 hypothetical protein [Marimonas arenosa]